jgi:predicted phosphoribosyltransferase
VFRDRGGAGSVLAEILAKSVAGRVVVGAIPRGGVAVALPIARRLRAPLAVVLARKLTVPIAPEFAFGAVDEDGHAVVDSASVAALLIGPPDIDAAQRSVAREIGLSRARYPTGGLAGHLPDRTVILVDDGLATGLTMEAAVAYARRHGARSVVVATPCASTLAAERLRDRVDQLVCPIVDEDFAAVAQYYLDFSPLSDAEVVALLARREAEEAGGGDGGSAEQVDGALAGAYGGRS